MLHYIDPAGCHIGQSSELTSPMDSLSFSFDFWQKQAETELIDDGRGGTLKITIEGQDAVLRQYRRGGLVRMISLDSYIWLGLKHTRPWREFVVLQQARALDLPVPEPLAVCVCHSGIHYRGSIMTRFIAATRSLSSVLGERELADDLWYRLGTVIRQFHHHRFRHADLNASNILIDDNDHFYLVDFDKARVMGDLGDWQWKPLYRLQQSLQKWQKSRRLVYREENWFSLMEGYQA